MPVTPHQLAAEQEVLDDLQQRLARTRWTDEYEGVGWDYGTNLGYLKELATYWQHGYDWRRHEAHLNSFPHYAAELAGESLTFLHARGTGPDPTPLLLLHGWPDSVCRYLKLIPLLTDPVGHGRDPGVCFDVVVPWLIGRYTGGPGAAATTVCPHRRATWT